jgi:hypothetical protein
LKSIGQSTQSNFSHGISLRRRGELADGGGGGGGGGADIGRGVDIEAGA